MRFLSIFACCAVLASQAAAISTGGQNFMVTEGSDGLQDIVKYDEHSLTVYGERLFIYSGEFHPYRLPVPGLYLDVFQKIKALGFNCVSFYTNWALVEGEPGVYNASGVFDFEPFFDAAVEAGIYLIARPGPYINAESSGGGFPGWLARVKGILRTRAEDYLAATDNYAANIGAAIAKAQITNGGPIILMQPENEYSVGTTSAAPVYFPDPVYMAYVEKQFRDAGVIVPFISNDASPNGYFAPGAVRNGTTEGDVDIYGHDGYPLGFDCANPYTWPAGYLPTYYTADHEKQSPSTPYSIVEFQGGSFDPWGGLGFAQCSILLNMEFERVFYKNNYASATALMNLYMIFGGTNWGNSGHDGGYTSYDYGSSITENREIYREKYSELKLQANFFKVSPDFLTVTRGTAVNGAYTDNSALTTTPVWGNGSVTNFYIVRHSDYQQTTSATYKLTVNTSMGAMTIPQLNGSLTLSGRDSKIHVTDYNVGGTTLLYSTAEIFTWKDFGKSKVLVVYGGSGELHEIAIITGSSANAVEGSDVMSQRLNGTTILSWKASATRNVVQVGDLFVYLLDRNAAYNYWVPDFVRDDKWGAYSAPIEQTSSVIVEAGYLIRGVQMKGSMLNIDGDLNATTPLRILGAPKNMSMLSFNNEMLNFTVNNMTGEWSSTLKYTKPSMTLPDLSALDWKYVDDLPEISAGYDDSAWTVADHATTNNSNALTTPTSLYASDYGYHTGVLVYRGHFDATGNESALLLATQGGDGFGSSVWLNSTYIGSWAGIDAANSYNTTYTLPNLINGQHYVITVVVDNNGLTENYTPGQDLLKLPRGVTSYQLVGRSQDAVTWKLTGNLGGEQYVDKVRGPLNEGGLYAERQGFTQPDPPNTDWAVSDPTTGITKAGVAFYQASFDLNMPKGYDVPLSFSFGNTTTDDAPMNYRAQLWVNGYQFGKYVNNIGPQSAFPVPQGILNYYGTNWLAVEIWAQQASGAHITDFGMVAGTPVLSSMKVPALAPMPGYSMRPGAY